MYLTSLELTNIRIIKSCNIELTKGVTAFVGDNGQGKTSILEAIYWASHSKSFRHVSDDDVISKGSNNAEIKVKITDDLRPQDIFVVINTQGRNSVLVNGQKLKRIKDLSNTLRVSIFTPDDLDIIKGTSSLRREVFDDSLQSISKKYVTAFSDYSKILKQKNAYLKSDEYDNGVLEVLNESLIMSGSQIIRARLTAVKNMRESLQNSYNHISGENSEISINYISKVIGNDTDDKEINEDIEIGDITSLFKNKIEEYSYIENIRRHSVVGPHRDDFLLKIHDRDTRTQASQGEQRSMALALKMGLHKLVHDETGDNPVLLLDDVFSELDIGRTHRLVECLPAAQTFVTTATQIPSTLKVDKTFLVDNGQINNEC
ncbi:MAG: DNA replication/repair protein RecF [Acidimicrobiia bacterium]